jgi:hypothetical protein
MKRRDPFGVNRRPAGGHKSSPKYKLLSIRVVGGRSSHACEVSARQLSTQDQPVYEVDITAALIAVFHGHERVLVRQNRRPYCPG